MMKLFRKHTKIIVWLIVVSFAIWGGYSATTLKKEGRYAGEVFGKAVTFQEYNKFYNATQLFMPAQDNSESENPDVIRTFTWQNVIYAREAKRLGIKVTDDEVRQQVANILTQQGIVAPTQEQYRIWLTRTLRISPREFEEGLREVIRIQQLIRKKLDELAPEPAVPPVDREKAAETLKQKKQEAFIQWTNELNKKAALKDYLALPPAPGEEPPPEETPVQKAKESFHLAPVKK